MPKRRSHLVYDPDTDEAEHEDLWLDVVKRIPHWPAVAAAAIAWDAWLNLNLYPRQPWLGLILAGAILRAWPHRPSAAARGRLQAVEVPAAGKGRSAGDAQGLLHGRGGGDGDRHQGSRPADPRPRADEAGDTRVSLELETSAVDRAAAKLLKVTPEAVGLMLAQLGGARPHELTGRARYRAWSNV